MCHFLREKAWAIYTAIGIVGTSIWAILAVGLMVQTQPQFDILNLAFDTAMNQGNIEAAFNALSQNTTLFKEYMNQSFQLTVYWISFILVYAAIGLIVIRRYNKRSGL